jgi:hypothetical protein
VFDDHLVAGVVSAGRGALHEGRAAVALPVGGVGQVGLAVGELQAHLAVVLGQRSGYRYLVLSVPTVLTLPTVPTVPTALAVLTVQTW